MKRNWGLARRALSLCQKGQLKNLKASYTLNQPQLTAPLEKGQVVGTIDFKLNDKTIEQRPLIVMESVKRAASSAG